MADNKDKKVLNVPALRFPEFTEKWKEYAIGKVLSIGNGRDYKHLHTGDIPVFGTGGYMTSVDDFLYDGESVFIGRKGTINKPLYYNGKFWTVDTLFYTHSFVNVLPKFVYCLFQTINWLKYNEASGVPSLSKATIEKIKVCIPSMDEQDKLSNLLFLLDKRIEVQNKIIEKLQSLIKGLVVTHYSTTDHTIKVKIQDLGKAYSTMVMSKEQLTNDGNPCIFYGELFTFYGCVIDKIKSRTNLEKASSTLSHGRDLLFPASTTVDALSLIAPSALMQKGIILGGDMFGIKVAETYNPIYLSYYFNYIANKRLSKYAKGTTIIHLHYNEIANIAIELPSIEEQAKVVSTIQGYSTKLSIEETILEKLSELKLCLLNQMFI